MAKRSSTRLLAPIVWVAAAIFLLSAGGAFAKSDGGKKGAAHRHAKLADARAIGGAKRCFAARLKRVNPHQARRLSRVQVRRRCGERPAQASRTPEPLLWGATIGSHLTGEQAPWDMSAVTRFEEGTGKAASIVQFFQPFALCNPGQPCDFYEFPTVPMESIRRHGSIPTLSWSSQSIPGSLDEADFQLSDVISGRYDDFIREFAEEAKAWGHPFFLRFNWEMNGNWFPWAEGVNGNQPGEYAAAWRHVHDVFNAVGVTNASWVWCPFVDPGDSMTDLASLYPGDAYVDWTGLDGYNWGTNPAAPKGWRSFDQLFRRTYDEIATAVAPSKPMMIGEVGSSEHGGSKAEWISDALTRVPAEYPAIRALLWFDKVDDDMDWPIESSSSATAAFAAGIQQPIYIGASYASLGGGAIQPPS